MSIILHSTIFDDVFRTMVQKMPQLLIPLINEVFHTDYSENECFKQLRNEYEEDSGRIITDSIIVIPNKTYHIECQSVDDTSMAVRMVEYDFAIALEQATKHGRMYEMDFPESCVLYLRCSGAIPNKLEVKVKKVIALLKEYEDIRRHLEKELLKDNQSVLYADMVNLIIRITDHILRKKENIRKGVGDAMGGKVLELESERLMKLGKAEEFIENIDNLINNLGLTLDAACKALGSSIQEYEESKKLFQ